MRCWLGGMVSSAEHRIYHITELLQLTKYNFCQPGCLEDPELVRLLNAGGIESDGDDSTDDDDDDKEDDDDDGEEEGGGGGGEEEAEEGEGAGGGRGGSKKKGAAEKGKG